MSRFNKLLNILSLGILSPKVFARKDMEEYQFGCEELDNFIPDVIAGFYNRNGTEYVADVTTLAVSLRGPALIPWVTGKDTAYAVVINFDGTAPVNHIKIYKNDKTLCTLGDRSTQNYTRPSVDPKGFIFAQVADWLFITHKSGTVRPILIVRDGDTSFTMFNPSEPWTTVTPPIATDPVLDLTLRFPYLDPNKTPTTMTPAATTGSGVRITASASHFRSGHVGSMIKITHGGTTGSAYIVTYVDVDKVDVDIVVAFGATTASDNWQESAWSDERGWPKSVALQDQRVVWGGNDFLKDTIWASQLGNYLNMMSKRLVQDVGSDVSGIDYYMPTIPDDQKVFSGAGLQVLEDDPFNFSLASNEINEISWLSAGKNLLAGTTGAEFAIGGEGKGISILTVKSQQQTEFGSAILKVVRMGNDVLFVSRDGKKIRNFKFNDRNGSFVSANVTYTSDQIRKAGDSIFTEFADAYEFLDVTKQKDRDIVWYINSTNTLIGLLYSLENGFTSFFRCSFPNSDAPPATGTSVNVWGACSIPAESGGYDELYLILERTINAARAFYLERIGDYFDADTLTITPYIGEHLPAYLDSYLYIDNLLLAYTTTIGGLTHLEDRTVRVCYRGEKLGEYTVASGSITLSAADQIKFQTAGVGFVGIEYESSFISADLEAGGDLGYSEGHTQRIDTAYVRFFQTRYAKVGSVDTQYPINFDHANSYDLFNGIKEARIPNSPDIDQKIKIVCDEPYPCKVVGIALRGNTDD